MLAHWIILTGFEMEENVLINWSHVYQVSESVASHQECCAASQPRLGVCWHDELRYWHFERRLALICPYMPSGWGWSTWCLMIPQIEPALDSSFINWEYVTFEVQLQSMLRRLVLWIYYFTTPPQFTSEYVDKSSLIANLQTGWLFYWGKGLLSVVSWPDLNLCDLVNLTLEMFLLH